MRNLIDWVFIVAQIVGFFAMGFAIFSYQLGKRNHIILTQNISNLFWVIQYILLGAYSAVVVNVIAIIRNSLYSLRGKYKFADSVWLPILSAVAFVVSGIFTYQTPFDILPCFAMVVASVAFFLKNENAIRYLSIIVAIPWITFSAYTRSIPGVLSDSISLVSIIIALIRYKKADSDFSLYPGEED